MAGVVSFTWVANVAKVGRYFFTTGCDSTWSIGRVSQDLAELPTLRREGDIGKDQYVEMCFVAVDSEGYLIPAKHSSLNIHFSPGMRERPLHLNIEAFKCSKDESNQSLKIFCKMTTCSFFSFKPNLPAGVKDKNSIIETKTYNPSLPKAENFASLSQDMNALLESGNFSDAVLCCCSKEVKIHKNILSSRSPVFAAMFVHQMQENLQNRVEITDIDENALMSMVTYMYTGAVQDSDFDTITSLYAAAEKYKIQGLKSICRRFLKCKISLDTVTDLLPFCEMFKDCELKMCAVNFVVENFQQLRSKECWEDFLKEHQKLGLELLNVIISASIPQK